ncbi:hypothetical protein M408DRAFT_24108 [Serendipita vermifera MAFF 305830]|uniref:BRCT domain-containing protein n=1 Tax=Serendipita vermifera MAFF 305830 TaxID=933852 RepID=A0A0C2WPG6_SERVB|nr:hypothetical protein M408DRAFT_24108 [Serendipita vermifera MAFF 305830]
METQCVNLFRLEDGESLSIAVHLQVPQHDRMTDMIRASNGTVVEDPLSAQFCVLSLNIPNLDGIVSELVSKGKLTVQDYWIRDSVELRRLLPWYSYRMVPPTSLTNNTIPIPLPISEEDVEARDIHELVVFLARYGLLSSSEDLYRRVSRKCPHRSVTSFKDLYATYRIDIDSKVLYIRSRLDVFLAFESDYHKRPLLNFGAPNKHAPRVAPASSTPSDLSTTPIGAGLGEQIAEEREVVTHAGTSHEEAPYDPPNMETISRPNSPVIDSIQQEMNLESLRDSEEMPGVEFEPSGRSPVATTPTIPRGTAVEVSKGSASKPHGGITDEDKHALAKFLIKYPQGKKSWSEHMKLFAEKYTRGGVRSAGAWRNVYHMWSVQEHIKNLEQKKATQSRIDKNHPKPTSPKRQPSRKEKQAPRAPAEKRNAAPVAPKRSPVEETADRDKAILARWMLENPKDPDSSLTSYFGEFHKQNQIGSTRPPSSWRKFASRHKETIQDLQEGIKEEMKGSNKSSPTRGETSSSPRVRKGGQDKLVTTSYDSENPVDESESESESEFISNSESESESESDSE